MNSVYTSKAARANKHVALIRQIFNVGTSKDCGITGEIDNVAGYAAKLTTIVIDGITATESSEITAPAFFNAGYVATGAANVATDAGSYTVTADGFTAAELLLMRRGSVVEITTGGTKYFYTLVSASSTTLVLEQPLTVATVDEDVIKVLDDTAYCITSKVETAGAITSLTFYPPLNTALSDNDSVVFGRGAAYLGTLTQDGSYAVSSSFTRNTRKNEGGEDCASNSVLSDETLTLNLCQSNFYSDYLFMGMLGRKTTLTGNLALVQDAAQGGFQMDRFYQVILPTYDTNGQFFEDPDKEVGFRRVQYTPESIERNGVPSNIDRALSPMFTMYYPETSYLTNKSYEGLSTE